MPSPSATLRKIRSSQTIGVDPVHSGISSFQAMLVLSSHSTGRFVSALTPSRVGPRQFGQFSACAAPPDHAMTHTTPTVTGPFRTIPSER